MLLKSFAFDPVVAVEVPPAAGEYDPQDVVCRPHLPDMVEPPHYDVTYPSDSPAA